MMPQAFTIVLHMFVTPASERPHQHIVDPSLNVEGHNYNDHKITLENKLEPLGRVPA